VRAIRLSLLSALVVTAATLTPTLAGASTSAMTPSLSSCQSSIRSLEYHQGTLTAATDDPGYTPWFVNNSPSNGKGYESAVVYAVAQELGIAKSNVKWTVEPFDASYTPGFKKFDFDINEISYTATRAKAVTFSVSYYNVHQSIVALKTNKIVTHHSPADLRNYLYGDQIGTTGLQYILNHIKPHRATQVYPTLNEALTALQAHQIDAIVVDTPTGQYMASSQLTDAKGKLIATQVGQFPSTGEHYAMLLQKGSRLVGCVDAALNALQQNGTLASLQQKWLGIYNAVPTLQP